MMWNNSNNNKIIKNCVLENCEFEVFIVINYMPNIKFYKIWF